MRGVWECVERAAPAIWAKAIEIWFFLEETLGYLASRCEQAREVMIYQRDGRSWRMARLAAVQVVM